jgi:spore coat protein CotH
MFGAQDFDFMGNAGSNYLQGMQSNNNRANTSIAGNGGGGIGGGGFGGIGFNMDTAKLALGGIQTLGNLWNAFQAQGLARDQFDFTKGITETNLTNQIKSYNTSIEDRIRSRGATEGQTQEQMDDYTTRNRVSR